MRVSPLLLLALSGCMTTGTNISGSFTCDAPDGVCAPMTAIDDEAIRSIAGTLAGMETTTANRPGEGAILASYGEGGTPGRTNERTAKVVFPARIDANGMYHEATVVHAVIEQPVWTDALRAPERQKVAQGATGDAAMAASASKRGAALATMDEVIAARAVRREGSTGARMSGVSEVRHAPSTVAPVSGPSKVAGVTPSEVVVSAPGLVVEQDGAAKQQGRLWLGPEQSSATAGASAADVESAAATRTLNAVSLSAAMGGAVLSVGSPTIAQGDAGEEPLP